MTTNFSATLLPLGDLLNAAASSTEMKVAWPAFCAVLRAAGLPIVRASLGLELLHPRVSGAQTVWTPDGVKEQMGPRADVARADVYLRSPTYIVDQSNEPFRRRLTGEQELPLLEELRVDGMTDYFMLPLPFEDRSRTAVTSFATRAGDGFTDYDIERLAAAAALFSPYAERYVLKRVAVDLLDTYVGPRTGRRVLSGEIDRGHFEVIDTAVWFADFRGFTELTEAQSIQATIATLNEWHALVAGVIHGHGGEVLKLIGDGVLAIFPAQDSETRNEACGRAYAAAQSLESAVARRNRTAARAIEFGIGLHVGEVAYGNVGAPDRLDFTVIGPAVNLAARLERISKDLGAPIAASREFQRLLGVPLEDRGPHRLKGFARPQRVYTPPPQAAATRAPALEEIP